MRYMSARLHVGTIAMLGIGAFVPTYQQPALSKAKSAAVDPLAILDRASASYDTVKTLQADFTQIVDNPMIGDPDTTRGKLYQKRSNYFEMRFTEPKNDRIVADGKHLWLYTPSTTPNQVIRTAIPSTGTSGPNLIGQFVEHPRERYDARYLRSDSLSDGIADVIALTPRANDLPYSAATVWIAKQDGLVRRIEIVETGGQRRTIVLRNLAVNRDIPAREFRFSPPGGTQVVDQ
ncbi:MAG TPA: outer membrane lipoprotein chaperone LolA [Gemmatimonadales bacterium]|nr:outer membrane lipoprotein chaperone LolA [Gemmatimonadales bacterium]